MSKPDDAGDVASASLSKLQRFLLAVFALIFGSLGIAAMFWTENEAGTAVTFLICGVLTLVAIQGTRVQRIAAGENSLDFARARIAIAKEAEANPEIGEALIESYQAVDPQAQADPAIVSAKASVYESQALTAVMMARGDIAPDASVIPSPADYALRLGDKVLLIEVKHRLPHRKLYLNDARQLMQMLDAANANAALIISNVGITADAKRFLDESPRRVRLIVWQPEEGREPIAAALTEILGDV